MNAGAITIGVFLIGGGLALLVGFCLLPETVAAMGSRCILGTLALIFIIGGVAMFVRPNEDGHRR